MICVEAATDARLWVRGVKGVCTRETWSYATAAQHDALELTDYKTSSGGQCSLKNA